MVRPAMQEEPDVRQKKLRPYIRHRVEAPLPAPSCPDGIRAHPRPYQSRSLGGAGFCTNQVFGNAELAFPAITVRFTLRNSWWGVLR